jgi:hypothetical protein
MGREEEVNMKGGNLTQESDGPYDDCCSHEREPEAFNVEENLCQAKEYHKECHADRVLEQEHQMHQHIADVETITNALNLANKSGAFTLDEAYDVTSAVRRLF